MADRKHAPDDDDMLPEYDFSKGRRGSILPHEGKTRITMWVDTKTLTWFRDWSERNARGYQTVMNEALGAYAFGDRRPLADVLREIVRSEIKAALKK